MIGVVVIGRNEGERLRRCLASVLRLGAPVIYVDSGSTDGSPALAERLGARVAALDPAQGFTAARARNLGFRTLVEAAPETAFVQFVDGDCEILEGWIEAARLRLTEDAGLGVVAGRRRERFPEVSIFNRLCDMEWNTPVGPAAAVGGDALYRARAFAAVGGFDASLICGEEPELCLRLRRAGWRIERIDRDMALHDAAISRLSQWVRRTIRGGWAIEEGAARHGAGPEAYNMHARRSIWFWAATVPASILGCILLAAGLAATGSALWSAPLGLATVGASAYPLMILRIACRRSVAFGDPWPDALLYGAFVMLGKGPELVGSLRYRLTRRRGAPARIIEYKGAR